MTQKLQLWDISLTTVYRKYRDYIYHRLKMIRADTSVSPYWCWDPQVGNHCPIIVFIGNHMKSLQASLPAPAPIPALEDQ